MKKMLFPQAAKFFAFTISLLLLFGTALLGCQPTEDPQQGGTKGFSINQADDYDFPKANEGYKPITPKPVRVTNEGGTVIDIVVALSGINSANFTLYNSVTSFELQANEDKLFRVGPRHSLETGTYTATVTVSATDYASKSFNVSFEVGSPPEEQNHLYIAFGQSNMQGPGEAQASDQSNVPERFKTLNTVAGVYAYGTTANGGNRNKGQWYTAVPPNIIEGTNPTGSTGTKVGLSPMDYFGRTVVDGTSEKITIGVVAVANGDLALSSFRKTRGATYFSTGQGGTVDGITRTSGRPSSTELQGWNRYTRVYKSIYDAIVTNVKLAQTQGWTVKGIILHQGESLRGLEDKTWVEILKEIYDDILEDCDLTADSIPILCGQPYGGSGTTSAGNDGGANLGNQLNADNRIQNTIPNAWVIDSVGLADRNDKIHFSTQGIRDLGTRYGEKMLELVYK
jgi:hypothetical protein